MIFESDWKGRNEIESLSGAGAEYVTDYVGSDTLREFTSSFGIEVGILVEG